MLNRAGAFYIPDQLENLREYKLEARRVVEGCIETALPRRCLFSCMKTSLKHSTFQSVEVGLTHISGEDEIWKFQKRYENRSRRCKSALILVLQRCYIHQGRSSVLLLTTMVLRWVSLQRQLSRFCQSLPFMSETAFYIWARWQVALTRLKDVRGQK